jgi:hypothetical protein
MLHCNEDFIKRGLMYALRHTLDFEMYLASSIQDFVESRHDVLPTSPLKCAARSMFLINGKAYVGKAVIFLQDVKYSRTGALTDISVRLEDTTGSLTMPAHDPWYHLDDAKRQGVWSGQLIQGASILYMPRNDGLWFSTMVKYLDIPRRQKAVPAERTYAPGILPV